MAIRKENSIDCKRLKEKLQENTNSKALLKYRRCLQINVNLLFYTLIIF